MNRFFPSLLTLVVLSLLPHAAFAQPADVASAQSAKEQKLVGTWVPEIVLDDAKLIEKLKSNAEWKEY